MKKSTTKYLAKQDIQNRIKYIIMGLIGGFALVNSGGIEFLKGLM